jgi:mannose-6-phosphate isomerase
MGTHPNVPATLQSSTSTTLASHLTANPGLIGEKVAKKFEVKDGNLPFLFKVLSIGTALSIQAHPDKKLAERLFKEHGEIYKGKSRRKYLNLGHVGLIARPQP